MLKNFTEMDAWQKAMDLAVKIHGLTKSYPKEEVYGITSQMRRASLSIAANIAEGFGRYTFPDKKHKYIQARGELIEVMTFLHYSERVSYINKVTKMSLLENCKDVHKLLNALISKMDKMHSEALGPKS
ncbi:four helix bundle protein [Patescibacteria group bacterium]|nr:four helix bundle protein [Patescibacteria group bacterium]